MATGVRFGIARRKRSQATLICGIGSVDDSHKSPQAPEGNFFGVSRLRTRQFNASRPAINRGNEAMARGCLAVGSNAAGKSRVDKVCGDSRGAAVTVSRE